MKASRAKLILNYVLPTILSQCALFLFTIVDGIFVGRGVGTDALGGSQSCPAACYDHRRGIYADHHRRRDHHRHPHGTEGLCRRKPVLSARRCRNARCRSILYCDRYCVYQTAGYTAGRKRRLCGNGLRLSFLVYRLYDPLRPCRHPAGLRPERRRADVRHGFHHRQHRFEHFSRLAVCFPAKAGSGGRRSPCSA